MDFNNVLHQCSDYSDNIDRLLCMIFHKKETKFLNGALFHLLESARFSVEYLSLAPKSGSRYVPTLPA